jgi:hypothetical protein
MAGFVLMGSGLLPKAGVRDRTRDWRFRVKTHVFCYFGYEGEDPELGRLGATG